MQADKQHVICLEMDDASGKNKKGKVANLDDWTYFNGFLKSIGAFVTIAIEPQGASEDVMRYLANNPDSFYPTVHGTSKYGHYGGEKTKDQIRDMWMWTVEEIRRYGFDIGLDGNEVFIPPMHMISDTAIDVLHDFGVKAIGSETSNFPLGSREILNSKGERVYRLSERVEPNTPYKGVKFYRRFRPWMMNAGVNSKSELLEQIRLIEHSSSRASMISGSYDEFLQLCERDLKQHCLEGGASFYAHELNLGGDRPFMDVLERFAERGYFQGARFVNAKDLLKVYNV